jgi:IS4 transposase
VFQSLLGYLKLHLLLDHQGLLPSYVVVTEGRVHESRVARSLRFEPGTIVVFDRGYTDYAWFAALDADGVFFVTRMKDNADYEVVERRPVPARSPVQRDQIVFLYKLARAGKPDLFLRRIEVWDETQQRSLVFLTNHRHFAASTIAQIYRQRWQIELFFESSTWCTPLDAMEFQGPIALNRPLVGLLDGSVPQRIGRRPLRVESRVHPRRPASPATVSAESAARQWSA